MAEYKCNECDRIFSSEEAFSMHNSAKHEGKNKLAKKKKININKKKVRNWIIFILVLGGIILLFVSLLSNSKSLPPTDMSGHIEVSPPSHILKEPMSLVIQKHMLEHADGIEGGQGGVIINYNCEDFECEDNLIEELEKFAESYPANVYVAPFKRMSVKIAVTRLGKIITMDVYDGQAIDRFINGR